MEKLEIEPTPRARACKKNGSKSELKYLKCRENILRRPWKSNYHRCCLALEWQCGFVSEVAFQNIGGQHQASLLFAQVEQKNIHLLGACSVVTRSCRISLSTDSGRFSMFLRHTIVRSLPTNANYLQQWKLKNHTPLFATTCLVSSLWFIDLSSFSPHTFLYRSPVQSTDGGKSIARRQQLAVWCMAHKRIFKKTPPYHQTH